MPDGRSPHLFLEVSLTSWVGASCDGTGAWDGGAEAGFSAGRLAGRPRIVIWERPVVEAVLADFPVGRGCGSTLEPEVV